MGKTTFESVYDAVKYFDPKYLELLKKAFDDYEKKEAELKKTKNN